MSDKIVRHDPFNMMAELNDVFDRIFDVDVFQPNRRAFPMSAAAARSHEVSIDEDKLRMSIDLPGVKSSDMKVLVQGHEVAVQAKRGQRSQSYRYAIHQDYVAASAAAQLADGVLTLTFFRRPESKPRQVEITVV
jgi:HSP20 family molecular chaperone IbpA